jgi:dihydroorotate dehydrogenase
MISEKIIEGIGEYMQRHGVKSVEELVGAMEIN